MVQENEAGTDSTADAVRVPGCYDGVCTNPDDEYAAGTGSAAQRIFEFNEAATLFSIDVFDIKGSRGGSEQGVQIDFWDTEGNFFCVIFPVTGDNGAARIIFNGGSGYANVAKAKAKVTLRGAGAIDNLSGSTRGGATPSVPEPGKMLLLDLSLLGARFGTRHFKR